MLKPRYRTNRLICGIDSSPFTVVLLVVVVTLLVIFMTVPHPYPAVSVDLPRVGHPISMWQAERRKAMVVGIQRDGILMFRNDRIRVSDLPGRIQKSVSQGSERKVYIKADARAKYGSVEEVLDAVHAAGIEKIGFLAYQSKTPASIP